MKRYIPLAALLLSACATEPAQQIYAIDTAPIPASVETAPMTGTGDKADDPAVWVNVANPADSLVLGTNKDEGLHVYNLAGEELQFLDVGRVNNVDLRGDVAVASNDETNSISWFAIDPVTATVSHVGDTPTQKDEPYGICAGQVGTTYYAMPTYKDGMAQVWSVQTDKMSEGPELVAEIQVGQFGQLQLEGCVFDEANGQVFLGEEEHGIWKLDLNDWSAAPVSVDTIAAQNGLVADVEGMDIWAGADGAGYLVASSQAADRFVVYDLKAPHAPRGVFTVTTNADGSIDAVTHTDGLDVSSAALPGFPKGILVVQDDGNPASGVDQNFKLVDWSLIESALGLD
ncbi:MAG: phytase [Hyphomonas sp.]|uniref:phytase n=1 Tax=Hyphomonas sp. TaxID=87 RepID=UPI001B0A4B71|nr:phytase [Hyphomonas sp.]MBO6581918.1 phytase [Hyphomonas sp.]